MAGKLSKSINLLDENGSLVILGIGDVTSLILASFLLNFEVKFDNLSPKSDPCFCFGSGGICNLRNVSGCQKNIKHRHNNQMRHTFCVLFLRPLDTILDVEYICNIC